MSSGRKFIPVAHPVLDGNEASYVMDCLGTEWISSVGPYIGRFESAFAEFVDVRHAASCNNGTSALHLAYLALGLQPGDEVLMPTLTYVATANAVRYCGAVPVFVDSSPGTMNLDPEQLERCLTPRTRGIVAVHLYGHPADMDPILAFAREHDLFVVEDAAEAHGGRYRGAACGSLADLGTFSFFGNKIISTGEGGMVTGNDDRLDQAFRLYRGQGMQPDRRYWFTVVGYNYRMTNVQAAIGLAQLENAKLHLGRRRDVARWYRDLLGDLEPLVLLPVEEPWAEHAYWIYTVVLGDEVVLQRDELMERLAADGIETRPVFHPMHTLPPYRTSEASFPVAERLGARGVSLPTHGRLTQDDVAYVAERLRACCLGTR
jgi:perosamine synthetase